MTGGWYENGRWVDQPFDGAGERAPDALESLRRDGMAIALRKEARPLPDAAVMKKVDPADVQEIDELFAKIKGFVESDGTSSEGSPVEMAWLRLRAILVPKP